MPQVFLGIDVSTTGSTVIALDEHGSILTTHTYPHGLSTPRPLWSEQDPDDWWNATLQALRETLVTISAQDVAAIGLSGQMMGLTALDGAGKPLRPAMLWNDQRSGQQCAQMTAQIGAERLHTVMGSIMLPGIVAPKLLWLREHEPEIYRQIEHIVLPKDYIRLKLSGAYVTDVSDGSGFGLIDMRTRSWSDELIDAFDIPRAWLPSLCESPEICAYVTVEAAAQTGLRQGTPIVGGAGDQPAQAIGSGIVQSGQTSITVGTSGVVFTAADQYSPDAQGRMHIWCHAIPETWCYIGVMLSAAGSLRWLHDELREELSYEELSALAAALPIGSEGLLFAPYLSGERHPYADPLARGAFVGLTLRHGLAHLVRSTMEGVAFGLRDLLEIARSKGIQPRSAAVSGGAASSTVWRDILTNVMGIPLYTVNTVQGAAFGAAILAGVGAGAWRDVPTACQMLIKPDAVMPPTSAKVQRYEDLYRLFSKLYPALQEMNVALAVYSETD
jgi:xylulokinase